MFMVPSLLSVSFSFCVCSVNLENRVSEYAYWADCFQQLPLYFMGFYGPIGVRSVIEVNRQVFVVCTIKLHIVNLLKLNIYGSYVINVLTMIVFILATGYYLVKSYHIY